MSPDFQEERDLADRYSAMSDSDLLKIASQPWTLSDSAWEILEDELDRRDLDIPESEILPPIRLLDKRNLVLLRRFRDIPEALLAKGKLDSAGMACFLADDNMVRLDWFISNLLGGVKLLVDAEDFSEASRILNEPIPEAFDFEGTEQFEQPRCPKCQSLDVNFEELYKPIAFGSLFVNFPLPVHRQGWICKACGHTWDDDEPSERKG
jgi:Putative prokaryotic signal transducing protein